MQITGKCDNPDCNNEYNVSLKQFKKSKYHFCSRSCRLKIMIQKNLMWATCDNPDCDVHFQRNKMYVMNPNRKKFCSRKCHRKTVNDKEKEKVSRSYLSALTRMPVHDLPQEFIEAKRTALLLKRQCGLYKKKPSNNPKTTNQHG